MVEGSEKGNAAAPYLNRGPALPSLHRPSSVSFHHLRIELSRPALWMPRPRPLERLQLDNRDPVKKQEKVDVRTYGMGYEGSIPGRSLASPGGFPRPTALGCWVAMRTTVRSAPRVLVVALPVATLFAGHRWAP